MSVDISNLPIEQDGQTRLKNVAGLSEAIKFLRETVGEVQWQYADLAFFPNIKISGVYLNSMEFRQPDHENCAHHPI
jgi:hypothetical protein